MRKILPVLWIRKYFFLIRIRGSVILNYRFGSGRQINYRSGSYLDIFVAIGKNMFSQMVLNHKIIGVKYGFLKFLKILGIFDKY
jgi:hypothetical protein